MNIPKAIEILTEQVRFYHQIHQLDIINSLQLGIEALKVFSELDPMFRVAPFGLLPGETED